MIEVSITKSYTELCRLTPVVITPRSETQSNRLTNGIRWYKPKEIGSEAHDIDIYARKESVDSKDKDKIHTYPAESSPPTILNHMKGTSTITGVDIFGKLQLFEEREKISPGGVLSRFVEGTQEYRILKEVSPTGKGPI